jgi:hypothetical protein
MTDAPKVIWTAKAIGGRIGVSADFVRDVLAKEPGTPIKQVGSRYCTVEQDLIDFFRSHAA